MQRGWRSDLAKYYAITSLVEAKAFAEHVYLGANYTNCLEAILNHPDLSIDDILGETDARNLRSSLTLLKRAGVYGEMARLIKQALEQLFYGEECQRTLKLFPIGTG